MLSHFYLNQNLQEKSSSGLQEHYTEMCNRLLHGNKLQDTCIYLILCFFLYMHKARFDQLSDFTHAPTGGSISKLSSAAEFH